MLKVGVGDCGCSGKHVGGLCFYEGDVSSACGSGFCRTDAVSASRPPQPNLEKDTGVNEMWTLRKSRKSSAFDYIRYVQCALGCESEDAAYFAVRAVFHAIRDMLTEEQSIKFVRGMPAMLVDIYYDGWNPAEGWQDVGRSGFLCKVREGLAGGVDPLAAIKSVFSVLDNRILRGEIEDLRSLLPREVLGLWPRTLVSCGGIPVSDVSFIVTGKMPESKAICQLEVI